MDFEIYCDESNPDAFCSKSANAPQYLLIGGVWLPADRREHIKNKMREVKEEHGIGSEMKWHKVSQKTVSFYKSMVDVFIGMEDTLRFRCIAVDKGLVNFDVHHEGDRELGFYKFYYQLIKHWLYDFNDYVIFCDMKSNRVRDRFHVLKRCLVHSNILASVTSVQALPSREVLLLQLADMLVGMAASRMNGSIAEGSPKDEVIRYLEKQLRVERLGPTGSGEQKFNVFRINLQGGW